MWVYYENDSWKDIRVASLDFLKSFVDFKYDIDLPEYYCSLELRYCNLAEDIDDFYIKSYLLDVYDFEDNDFYEILDTKNYWSMTWYPNTSVGCYNMAAPTLERLNFRINLDKI